MGVPPAFWIRKLYVPLRVREKAMVLLQWRVGMMRKDNTTIRKIRIQRGSESGWGQKTHHPTLPSQASCGTGCRMTLKWSWPHYLHQEIVYSIQGLQHLASTCHTRHTDLAPQSAAHLSLPHIAATPLDQQPFLSANTGLQLIFVHSGLRKCLLNVT